RDPEATQAYPTGPSTYGSGPSSGGPLSSSPLSSGPISSNPLSSGPLSSSSPLSAGPHTTGPLAQNPLGSAGPFSPPPRSANPLPSGPLGGQPPYKPEPQPATDTDGQRLPTVDELLQKIQADRRKSEAPTTSYSGGSLTDPLNDPLTTGERDASSYGTTWSAPTPAPSSPSYDSDPLGGGTGGSGYGSYGSEGYPKAPAYGEPPRYDDPLAGYSSSPGTGSYGGSSSYRSESTPEAGRYGDFTGSSFNGDAGGDAAQPNAQAPGAGGYYPGEQQGFYPAPTPEPPAAYPSGPYEKKPASAEEWDSYRDYRH
ncbi:MAG: hypothetical protein ABIS86_02405, partial [Streptosporangiaceae bacterium]